MDLKDYIEKHPLVIYLSAIGIGFAAGIGVSQFGIGHGIAMGLNEQFISMEEHNSRITELRLSKFKKIVVLMDEEKMQVRFQLVKDELYKIPYITVHPIPVDPECTKNI